MVGAQNVKEAEVTVHAFMQLPVEERALQIDRVGEVFRAAVQADYRAKNWSKLTSWAHQAENVTGLDGSVGSFEFCETHWALTWGSVITKEFERARLWYEPLHALLMQRSPDFAEAMLAMVNGKPSLELVAPFLKAKPVLDPRLGYEPSRKKVSWVMPSTEGEVEPTLLALVAQEPWGVVASTVTQWSLKSSEAVSKAMWLLAAQLAVREVVKRTGAHHHQASSHVEFFRKAVEALRAPPCLSADALLIFRILAAKMPSEIDSAAHTRELTHAAVAASAYGAHRPLVVAVVTQLKCAVSAGVPLLGLLEHLALQASEMALVGKAMLLLTSTVEAPRVQPFFLRAFSTLLSQQGTLVSEWFEGLSDANRFHLTEWMAAACSFELSQTFLLAVWSQASSRSRRSLIALVENVLLRANHEEVPAERGDVLNAPLAAKARAFWAAVRTLVLPDAPEFLEFALVNAQSGDDLNPLVQAGLGLNPDVRHMLDVWDIVRRLKHVALTNDVERQLLTRYGRDTSALALAVLTAYERAFPLSFKRKLAEALVAAVEGLQLTPHIRSALVLAQRWLVSRKTAQPRAAKAGRKSKTSRKKRTPPPESGFVPV